MRRKLTLLAVAAMLLAACTGANSSDDASDPQSDDLTGIEHPQTLGVGESEILLVATNDVHGSLDHFPQFGGYVDAARAHALHSYGTKSTVLLLDAGDMTQGTLLSNFSEGQVAINAMNKLGYTAAITGNHGFDFGPEGWKIDQCPGASDPNADPSCDPLAALERTVKQAAFPFLGANVKQKSNGKTLDFLPPSTIVTHQGRGIAIIGLENHFTPSTTIPENVAALTFTDGVADLQNQVETLYASGNADVFILVMHEGDADQKLMEAFLNSLPKRSTGEPLVDAAIAGHSHTINDAIANDIPYIQSGANGQLFGTIELIAKKDATTGRLSIEHNKMRKKAAIPIADKPTTFLGEPVHLRADLATIVTAAETQIAPIANQKLTMAPTAISRDNGRLADSQIGNVITDSMRRATQADVAIINGGDIRADIAQGEILYQDLFQVIPKNLELVTVNEMPTTTFVKQVLLSVQSCGVRGALQVSGMTLVFHRDCSHAPSGSDGHASIVALLDANNQPIYTKNGTQEVFAKQTIKVATTDFVMSGGSGYSKFIGLTADSTLVLRDEVASDMQSVGVTANGFATGRYVNCTDVPTDARCQQ